MSQVGCNKFRQARQPIAAQKWQTATVTLNTEQVHGMHHCPAKGPALLDSHYFTHHVLPCPLTPPGAAPLPFPPSSVLHVFVSLVRCFYSHYLRWPWKEGCLGSGMQVASGTSSSFLA